VAPKWDTLAGNDMKKVESRKAYQQSTAPASTYKAPSGKELKIDPKDKQISYLRGKLSQSQWENRQLRQDQFYSSYYNRPALVYTDCYNPYWNYYLMTRPINDIAMWLYMHQLTMDSARLNWYYSQNAELKARVAALEAKGIPRDTTYCPPGVDPDIAYNDGYVNAAWNPTPRTQTHYHYEDGSGSSVLWVLLWIFVFIPLMVCGVLLIYYFVFVYRA